MLSHLIWHKEIFLGFDVENILFQTKQDIDDLKHKCITQISLSFTIIVSNVYAIDKKNICANKLDL